MSQYVLNADRTVEQMDDIVEWARRFELDSRIVAVSVLGDGKDACRVSTVFLGITHGRDDRGRPLLFETMVFGGTMDGEEARHATYAEAEAGHLQMVRNVRGALQAQVAESSPGSGSSSKS